jgi:hypothetical protein
MHPARMPAAFPVPEGGVTPAGWFVVRRHG